MKTKNYDTILSESVQEYLMKERMLYKEAKRNAIIDNFNLPDKPNSRGLFVINVNNGSNRKQLTSKTLDGLKDKIVAFVEQSSPMSSDVTVKDIFEKVCENKLKYVKDKERLLSVKETVRRDRQQYNRFIKDTFIENICVADITKSDIEMLTEFNLKRYDLKEKAFSSYKGLLRSIFHLAYEEYVIVDNVFERVNFKKFVLMLSKETDIEERVHNEAEVISILDYLHTLQNTPREFVVSSEKYHKKYVSIHTILSAFALELQMMCGLRRGEVAPLMWSDCNDNWLEINKMLQVQRNGTYTYRIVEHTKNHKKRKFPMTSELSTILKRLTEFHKEFQLNSPYLFPDERECINLTAVYTVYKRACRELNIKLCKDYTKGTHSFRRNAITDFANKSNGNILLASEIYGNSPICATRNYYVGADIDKARMILET